MAADDEATTRVTNDASSDDDDDDADEITNTVHFDPSRPFCAYCYPPPPPFPPNG